MRAYQLRKLVDSNYVNVSVPFESFEEAKRLLVKLVNVPEDLPLFTIEKVEVKQGEPIRDGNTIYVDNILRGVYYKHQIESI